MWRNVPLNRAGAFIVCCEQGREAQIIARVRHVCSQAAPIVLLSEPNSSQSIAGLMSGADFVFPAPIESATLHAARLAFRRAHGEVVLDAKHSEPAITPSAAAQTDPLGMIEAGPLKIDRQMRRLWIRGEEVSISERPFELLRYMIERLGQCCSRSDIIHRVWDIDFDPGTNVIDVQIYKLRGILEEHGLRDMLQTVRGRGYRLMWPLPTEEPEEQKTVT
jgi:DNA-binding response OmpR family regulator